VLPKPEAIAALAADLQALEPEPEVQERQQADRPQDEEKRPPNKATVTKAKKFLSSSASNIAGWLELCIPVTFHSIFYDIPMGDPHVTWSAINAKFNTTTKSATNANSTTLT
jgi:hypothetical protein